LSDDGSFALGAAVRPESHQGTASPIIDDKEVHTMISFEAIVIGSGLGGTCAAGHWLPSAAGCSCRSAMRHWAGSSSST